MRNFDFGTEVVCNLRTNGTTDEEAVLYFTMKVGLMRLANLQSA
jgi:hypothetical protein